MDSFEFDDFTSVAVRRCEVGHPTCYVGHLRMPPHVLPGKYLPAFNKVWSVINGNGVHGTDIEILAVHPGYQVTWMPFHAGDTLPVGAVEGGYFSNIIIPLFVVQGQVFSGNTVPSYCDPVGSNATWSIMGLCKEQTWTFLFCCETFLDMGQQALELFALSHGYRVSVSGSESFW